MEIVRLPIGEQAPVDADCIRIEQMAENKFTLAGSALCLGTDGAESVSIVDAPSFRPAREAEAAGTAWAEDICVGQLFISLGTLTQPLELIEIDKSM